MILESSTRGSVGDGVYAQIINPQQQVDKIISLLKPLADAGLILGYHGGNHEFRITKESGIDVSKMICGILKVPYLGEACWSLFRVGSNNYKIYTLHGCSGSKVESGS